MKNLKKYSPVLLALAFSLSATACNTIQGAGKDISSAGEKIEEVADK